MVIKMAISKACKDKASNKQDIILTNRDRDIFIDAIKSKEKPNNALKTAIKYYKKNVNSKF